MISAKACTRAQQDRVQRSLEAQLSTKEVITAVLVSRYNARRPNCAHLEEALVVAGVQVIQVFLQGRHLADDGQDLRRVNHLHRGITQVIQTAITSTA
jgi:hypothetical protein